MPLVWFRQVLRDRVVEANTFLRDELEHDGRQERLRDAADAKAVFGRQRDAAGHIRQTNGVDANGVVLSREPDRPGDACVHDAGKHGAEVHRPYSDAAA
jgi:hypothetical protein